MKKQNKSSNNVVSLCPATSIIADRMANGMSCTMNVLCVLISLQFAIKTKFMMHLSGNNRNEYICFWVGLLFALSSIWTWICYIGKIHSAFLQRRIREIFFVQSVKIQYNLCFKKHLFFQEFSFFKRSLRNFNILQS